jgi:hypothetical protein
MVAYLGPSWSLEKLDANHRPTLAAVRKPDHIVEGWTQPDIFSVSRPTGARLYSSQDIEGFDARGKTFFPANEDPLDLFIAAATKQDFDEYRKGRGMALFDTSSMHYDEAVKDTQTLLRWNRTARLHLPSNN